MEQAPKPEKKTSVPGIKPTEAWDAEKDRDEEAIEAIKKVFDAEDAKEDAKPHETAIEEIDRLLGKKKDQQ